jgi:hypothetical protein
MTKRGKTMNSKIPRYFAQIVGESKANTSQKTKTERKIFDAKRKFHEVSCYKCGEKRKIPLKVLNAQLTSYKVMRTENEGNHFCCYECINSGLKEVREARINTASEQKLKKAIEVLKQARKFKAAELLESKLEALL